MKENKQNKKQQIPLLRLIKNKVPMADARRILGFKISDGTGIKIKNKD